jgi:hypothetical protein
MSGPTGDRWCGADAGEAKRPVADPVLEKIDELVDRSRGRVRADQADSKVVAMGFQGRSARRGGR